MTREEAKSCIGTIEMLQRLAYNIHGVMDVIDADNCKKIIKALEQEPILDKVRVEIQDIAFDSQEIDGEHESIMILELNDALNIIDKHKAKSEVEYGECK